jgi:drug/metabolite transporter (DMT)-like permease
MQAGRQPTTPVERVRIAFAFFSIYFVWGTTYLAIRIVVATVPPFLSAAIRFLIAGSVLLAIAAVRGSLRWERRYLLNATIVATLLFLIGYGGLFWSEQSVDSGIASVLVATIPVWIVIVDLLVFRQGSIRAPVLVSIVLGLSGVALLTVHSGAVNVPAAPVVVLTVGQVSWALGTLLSSRLSLPESKTAAAGMQMFIGGLLLAAAAYLAGEWRQRLVVSNHAAMALLYLAIPGSVLAFTAYLWLLRRVSPAVVGSYAYVNPVVALAVGHFLGNEPIGARALAGSALIVAGVVVSLRWAGR